MHDPGIPAPRLLDAETDALLEEVAGLRGDHSRTLFESRQAIARLLGAHHDPDTGHTRFGFWAPELTAHRIADREVELELFTPIDPIDFTASRAAVTFVRHRLSLMSEGDYWWGVLDGVRAGSKDQAGTFYWLRATDANGETLIERDLVAHSLPYGSFAPAEVYDMVSLQRGRSDLDHFATEATPPSSILELHIPTATAEGTVAALANRYRALGEQLAEGQALSDDAQVYAGYDAIQPLPVDPTIERPTGTPTFSVTDVVDELGGIVGVLLMQPDNQNWGYDNMVASSSATNPSLLATRRPDEIVALAEALHELPEPMMLIYDIVYGHADNQAAEVLPGRFFKGPNMYGLDLNHQDPTVRAILLEMQRRRMNTGCDGLRVDGAQDFKFYDPRTGQVEYDDEFLQSMSDVPQQIGPHERRVWMIFEDGRPWPAEGWETLSTYRDVIEKQPDTWQWGPLIFAHNTPMLENYWVDKFYRVQEIMQHGGHWISGCGNHDTVRRGTQVDPALPINHLLGDDLPTILDAAYDNAAITLLSYGFLPGIPMEFLNATTRTPWAFMRTTDDLYGVKVMAEEAGFLRWQLDDDTFAQPAVFRRTKRHGFTERQQLLDFLLQLQQLIDATDYDLDVIAVEIDNPPALGIGREGLLLLALDYMRDVHDLCNVGARLGELDSSSVQYAAELRALRRQHLWLRDDAGPDDVLELIEGEQTLYRGGRRSPDRARQVMLLANMAGAAWQGTLSDAFSAMDGTFDPAALADAQPLLSPNARLEGDRIVLPDGCGLLWVRTA